MKAYLIDPWNELISVVTYQGTIENIYKHIGASTFDVVRINEEGDAIYVDDEGLYRQPQQFWAYEDYPHPIAGKGLVLGTDHEGESISPRKVTVASLKESVRWLSHLEALEMAKDVTEQALKEAEGHPEHIVISSYDILKNREYTE